VARVRAGPPRARLSPIGTQFGWLPRRTPGGFAPARCQPPPRLRDEPSRSARTTSSLSSLHRRWAGQATSARRGHQGRQPCHRSACRPPVTTSPDKASTNAPPSTSSAAASSLLRRRVCPGQALSEISASGTSSMARSPQSDRPQIEDLRPCPGTDIQARHGRYQYSVPPASAYIALYSTAGCPRNARSAWPKL